MFDLLGKRSLRAMATLIGTIVGVGVFGLPFVIAKAGLVLGTAEFLLLAGFEFLLLLMYAEVTVHTEGTHRFSGYVRRYLGPTAGGVAFLAILLSMFGGLLAFTILGADFWSRLSGWGPLPSALLLTGIVACVTFGGIGLVSRVGTVVVTCILGLYAILIAVTLPSVQWVHLTALPNSWHGALTAYGVIIFALAGLGAVPEMHDLLGRDAKRLPRVLLVGYTLVVALYVLFTYAVVGASGFATTPDAIAGLASVVHPSLILFGTMLGVISVVSIHSMVAIELIQTIKVDLQIPQASAWALTMFFPLTLFVFGFREFISVLGFVGTIFSGVVGVLTVLTYEAMKKKKSRQAKRGFVLSSPVSYVVMAVFLIGFFIGFVLK